MFVKKIIRRTSRILIALVQFVRIYYYKILSDNICQGIKPNLNQPTIFFGKGLIRLSKGVNIGFSTSPFFLSGYSYFEARCKESEIIIGENFNSNNNIKIIAEKGKIIIGRDVLLGPSTEIINSDFHHIHPLKRNLGIHKSKDIIIKDNVFVGSNVTILKGVTVGENSVIASGSVVFENVAPNTIVRGNPAIFFKNIEL